MSKVEVVNTPDLLQGISFLQFQASLVTNIFMHAQSKTRNRANQGKQQVHVLNQAMAAWEDAHAIHLYLLVSMG